MTGPWVAIDATADRRRRALALARVHERVAAGDDEGEAAQELRRAIASSWRRSRTAGVDPTGQVAPLSLPEQEASLRWADHPLVVAPPLLRELLADVDDAAHQIVLVCDADGALLWLEGEPSVLEAAGEIHLSVGADWSEAAAGTNAMGTALAVGHAIQVFSAEHFSRAVHDWTCSAAPVHDPETGLMVGVIDLSGELNTAHPHSLSLVDALARRIEEALRARLLARDVALRERYANLVGRGPHHAMALVLPSGRVLLGPGQEAADAVRELTRPRASDSDREATGALERGGWDGAGLVAEPVEDGAAFLLHPRSRARPGATPTPRLEALGRDCAQLVLGPVRLRLSRRGSELLVLLALHPEGLSAERLALELYGDFGKPASVRAELSRLRRLLGERIEAHPYRLGSDVALDASELERLLREGRVREALTRYRGPLLPRSDAPAVVEARERLDHGLREAALAHPGAELLAEWVATVSGQDDLLACRELVRRLSENDPRRPGALSRLRRLARAPAHG